MSKRLFLISTTILIIILAIPFTIFGASLADPNDSFNVITPAPNTTTEGTQTVSWIMYDDDAVLIPFAADLLDGGTCTQSYGRITGETNGASHQSTPKTINWNTNSTQSTATLQDGTYCLRICVQLLNNGTPYSACNSRFITLVNNNELPVISSGPQNITLNEGEYWSGVINAFDPDGDNLTYSLVAAPQFVTLSGNTIYIYAPTISDNSTQQVYTVEYAVSDNLSGATNGSFTITVINTNYSGGGKTTNQPGGGSSSGGSGSGSSNSSETRIRFIHPSEGQILKDNSFTIEWTIDNKTAAAKLSTLEYSEDGVTWVKIGEVEGDETTFEWELNNVLEGAYFIRLRISFEDGRGFTQTSDKFIIDKDATEDFTSVPLIQNVRPENEEVQVEIKVIEGDFIPSVDAIIDPNSFSLFVDGEDITDECEVTATEFKCVFAESFEKGRHEATASISDSSGASNEYTWQFIVGDPTDPTPEDSSDNNTLQLFGRDIEQNTFYLLLLICCLVFALLFIPWLLYAMWRRDDEGNTTQTFETTVYPGDQTYPQTTVTTNYYPTDPYTTDQVQSYGYSEPQQTS